MAQDKGRIVLESPAQRPMNWPFKRSRFFANDLWLFGTLSSAASMFEIGKMGTGRCPLTSSMLRGCPKLDRNFAALTPMWMGR